MSNYQLHRKSKKLADLGSFILTILFCWNSSYFVENILDIWASSLSLMSPGPGLSLTVMGGLAVCSQDARDS